LEAQHSPSSLRQINLTATPFSLVVQMLRKNRSTCSPGLQDPMPAAGFPAGLSHLKDVSLMSYIVIHIFAFGDFVLSLKQKQPFVVKLGMVHY
jgi:hypothetical protein